MIERLARCFRLDPFQLMLRRRSRRSTEYPTQERRLHPVPTSFVLSEEQLHSLPCILRGEEAPTKLLVYFPRDRVLGRFTRLTATTGKPVGFLSAPHASHDRDAATFVCHHRVCGTTSGGANL
jgi:hypothetical protein